jgi:hypothetical protein
MNCESEPSDWRLDRRSIVESVPDLQTIMSVGGLTAPLVYGVVEAAKTFVRGRRDEEDDWATPWWYAGTLRVASLVIGGAAGTALYGALMGLNGWPWGTAIGVGGGAFATTIVAVIKGRLKGLG